MIISQTDDGLDSGTESDDETGGPDEGKQIFNLFLIMSLWKKIKFFIAIMVSAHKKISNRSCSYF